MSKSKTPRAARAPKIAEVVAEVVSGAPAEVVAEALEAVAGASAEVVAETLEALEGDERVGEAVAAEVAETAPASTDPLEEFGPETAPVAAPEKKPLSVRGLSVSATWARPEVRAARSTHHEVVVAGKGKFKSVPEAFRALGLPMGKMIPFRLLVKETGAAVFERVSKDGKKDVFEFSRVG